MAGFLDSKERVLDMVLTGVGKDLLFKGDLRFVYWIPFDDEVDYDPFITNSGSMTAEELVSFRQMKVEDPLIREATSGYKSLNAAEEDRTNVNRPMYTIPVNQTILPEMKFEGVSGTINVNVHQQKLQRTYVRKSSDGSSVIESIGPVDAGVNRFNPTEAGVQGDYTVGSYPREWDLEGFLLTVYQSGSEGYMEVLSNRDSSGSIVYNNDMKVEIL
jgi:hypothetical protein